MKGRFISLFAGIGGFDLGFEQAGHKCVAQVEWDKSAAGVLKYRFPGIPVFSDITKLSADDLPDCEIITYGFPCQDLSLAGTRKGLDGKRSGLFYEATRLIRELRAKGCRLRFAVAENVGGLFSADDGVAFARCIRELLNCGSSETGWRLLDSQYFGVAQRRKRVFIVSDFAGRSADEILSISESLPRHPAPSREAGQETAGDVEAGIGKHSKWPAQVAGTLDAHYGYKWGLEDQHVFGQNCSRFVQGGGGLNGQDAYTGRILAAEDVTTHKSYARRLTPIECERLQGFPDDWTELKTEVALRSNLWTSTGKLTKQADGPRYTQLGNAVTVNVANWLGRQIAKI